MRNITILALACSSIAVSASLAAQDGDFIYRYKSTLVSASGPGGGSQPPGTDIPGDPDGGGTPGDGDENPDGGGTPGDGDENPGDGEEIETGLPDDGSAAISFGTVARMDIGEPFSATLHRQALPAGETFVLGSSTTDGACGLSLNPATGSVSGTVSADEGQSCVVEVVGSVSGLSADFQKNAWSPLMETWSDDGFTAFQGESFTEGSGGWGYWYEFIGGNNSTWIEVSDPSLSFDMERGETWNNVGFYTGGTITGEAALNDLGVHTVTITARDDEGRSASHDLVYSVVAGAAPMELVFRDFTSQHYDEDHEPADGFQIYETTSSLDLDSPSRLFYHCFAGGGQYAWYGDISLPERVFPGGTSSGNIDVVPADQLGAAMPWMPTPNEGEEKDGETSSSACVRFRLKSDLTARDKFEDWGGYIVAGSGGGTHSFTQMSFRVDLR